jgi:hypothetical protein
MAASFRCRAKGRNTKSSRGLTPMLRIHAGSLERMTVSMMRVSFWLILIKPHF